MKEDVERFIANSSRLRILREIVAVRLVSSIENSAWNHIRVAAEEILHKANIPTLTREEFLEGNFGDAVLLIKWGLPSDEVGIAQLLLFADMQVPASDELHMCVIWLSKSLLLLDMKNYSEMEELLLNEIREFASAWQSARSLPGYPEQ